jgi:hypothetical protein
MSTPVDGVDDSRGPIISYLKIFHEWWAVGGIPDRGLVIVGDGSTIEL